MVLLRHRIFDPEVQSYLQRDPYPSTNSRDRELSTWSVIRYTDRPDDAPYLEAKGSQRLPLLSSGSVEHRIRERIIQASLDQTVDSEQAFYVADLSVVYKQYMKWRDHLPHIQPFFGECKDSLSSLTVERKKIQQSKATQIFIFYVSWLDWVPDSTVPLMVKFRKYSS